MLALGNLIVFGGFGRLSEELRTHTNPAGKRHARVTPRLMRP